MHTTHEHLFWSITRNVWIPAGALVPDEQLDTADGSAERVVTRTNFRGTATMYNLTVEVMHTYYILAGTTPVLVHNSDDEDIYDKYSQYDEYEDDTTDQKMMRGDNRASNAKARYQERRAGISTPEQRENVHRGVGDRKIGGNENVAAEDLREAIEDAGGSC